MEKVRPRFSLFSMVLLTTIVAMAVGLYASGRRNSELHAVNEQLAAKNKDYRNQLGIFDVEDSTKIHAIQVPTKAGHPREFRVYLPQGRRYVIHRKHSEIPEVGLPGDSWTSSIDPGEYLFKYQMERWKHPTSAAPLPEVLWHEEYEYVGDPEVAVSPRVHDEFFVIPWSLSDGSELVSSAFSGVSRELTVHDADEPLVLYRVRANAVEAKSRDANGKPTGFKFTHLPGNVDGFMLWIESEALPTP